MATVVESPPATVPAPVTTPGTGGVQRSSPWTRVRAWLRLAYTDLGCKEHHILLEWIIWMVNLSVVVTVLQQDAALDEQYQLAFRVVELFILIVFASDYTLNLVYAPSKRGYALSFSGIVDLLAIMPSFLVFFDTSTVKFLRALRFLRFLRILQVVKAISHRQAISGEDQENQSLLLDLQLGVIGVSALLLLVPEDALRNLLLICTLAVAVTTGLRRWLVYKQKPAISITVLLACVIGAMMYAQNLDLAGQQDWAIWFLVGSVVVAVVTWFQIEGPAGI
ncbi:MAG: ion transporter [Chloroflexota bacterium]